MRRGKPASATRSGITGLRRFLPRFVLLLVPLAAVPGGQAAAGQSFAHGLLWRIEVAGVAPSHVFGTFHISDPRIGDAAAGAARVLANSRSLTVEVLSDSQLQAEYARRIALPDGRTLDMILGRPLFRRVTDLAREYGYGPGVLKRIKPWAVIAMMSTPPREEQRRTRGEQHLDAILERLARRHGIAVHALETPDEQLSLFADLSEAEQVAMVEERVANDAEFRSNFETMVSLYAEADIGRFYRRGAEQLASQGDLLMQRFLIDRNHTMVERMQPRLQEGAALIAIGALHLGGEEGVLNLLSQKGYILERAD